MPTQIEKLPSENPLLEDSRKRTRILFENDVALPVEDPAESTAIKLRTKIRDEYAHISSLPPSLIPQSKNTTLDIEEPSSSIGLQLNKLIEDAPMPAHVPSSSALVLHSSNSTQQVSTIGQPQNSSLALAIAKPEFKRGPSIVDAPSTTALVRAQIHKTPKPEWHAPWKLMRVISGHLGWVRAVTVDVGNEWFATGAGDRIIKIWDLASGTLKLSLTGHVATIRGLAVSDRHPYLFSCGEDKQVKCWDLETNKVIRHYHGHLSGVYSLALHPTLDVLVTGGRDSVARVWDMRTRQCVHILSGHTSTVASVFAQNVDPQIGTGSMDSTVRLWDLAAGKTLTTLTHHKKSVRAMTVHPNEFTFASGSPDNIKQWKFPEGQFIQNLSGHRAIINAMSVNEENVMFSGGDDGTMKFWDWKSGYNYQTMDTIVQPGSLDSEAGIFCSTFDRSGTRLITGEADKTIKIWKQDPDATPTTHPITDWKPSLKKDHY